ncbi:uncharacterized protein AMSG_10174, partial [Thecamonas trahens ATCC 50062]
HPRVDPTADDNYVLRWAVRKHHVGAITLLLADPQIDPTTIAAELVDDALRRGGGKTLEVLLADSRINRAIDRAATLLSAAVSGDATTVANLLSDDSVGTGVDFDALLRTAIENGHAPVVELLLADGRSDVTAVVDRLPRLRWRSSVGTPTLLRSSLLTRALTPTLKTALRSGTLSFVIAWSWCRCCSLTRGLILQSATTGRRTLRGANAEPQSWRF